ncbi:uncharacterized protein FIBRA_06388 [Fibroporia radiculosa]|uniref:Arrestin-like N-terminal domain-containing protein n=1 Tax=Fibroporia radiculosa TaxID=599839 RepID=J4IB85_9APHY|nr:uncharacterized protein FIBRA_06388 [Fibroporia radiculosa]CCM04221.1 predicted protein [Fibroporia radiculosa]
MVAPATLEPMNASPHHAKVKVSLTLSDSMFLAGRSVTGKMEMECKADKGLGIGVIMVELVAVEELTSRDHSATSMFLHSRRLFQGPGLPPSNAVQAYPNPGDPSFPAHYYPARRGISTFFFKLPLPESSPSAIDFGSGLAQVRYEVRATAAVAWKGENKLVFNKRGVDVVESFEEDFSRVDQEAVVVGENGKIWIQGRVVGGFMVAGQPGCIELQVKNHSAKKNTGLSVSLIRELFLPNQPIAQKQILQISDTLTSVSFRGPEYVISPGAEGVANLVFDLPHNARGVKGGTRSGNEEDDRTVDPLFEVRCTILVKLTMGIGSKDIVLRLPVAVLHPIAVPDVDPYLALPNPHIAPTYGLTTAMAYSPPVSPAPAQIMSRSLSPAAPGFPPVSPLPYIDQGQVWLPPPIYPVYHTTPPAPFTQPMSYHYYHNVIPSQSLVAPWVSPPRPSSAEPIPSQPLYGLQSHLPPVPPMQPLLPLSTGTEHIAEREEGKGERASRIALHLRMSSRHRSASPPAHRYSMPTATEPFAPLAPTTHTSSLPIPVNILEEVANLSSTSSPRTQRHRLSPLDVSVSPARSQDSIASPRPMLSPQHSFSGDPFDQVTQVEQLERVAAQADSASPNMSVPGRALSLDADVQDKTLPRIPDGTHRTSPAIDALFHIDDIHPKDTPPTPTLAAITSLKVPRAAGLGVGLSGLDALEAKLLAEVGTRKQDKPARPDVRSVLPIAIPRGTDGDPANDSAISSLTLPGLDADAKTLRLGRTSHSPDQGQRELDDDRTSTGGRRGRDNKRSKGAGTVSMRSPNDKENASSKRSGQRVATTKDEEIHRLKKSAQGRVAAWLGCIDPDIPPQSGTPPSASPRGGEAGIDDIAPINAPNQVEASLGSFQLQAASMADPPPIALSSSEVKEVAKHIEEPALSQNTPRPGPIPDVSALPNPRSSGFVPIGTLQVNRSQIAISTKSGADPKDLGRVKPSTRLAVYPPHPVDSGVRYDVRSARGGKGGKVTSVAAIWASAAESTSKTDKSNKPTPRKRLEPTPFEDARSGKTISKSASQSPKPPMKPAASAVSVPKIPQPATKSSNIALPPAGDIAAKRARMVKSSSVPAIISSSLATPMLSSTASLARPTPRLKERNNKINVSLTPLASEDKPDANLVKSQGELAFGQARLRELIKRYQGQPNN